MNSRQIENLLQQVKDGKVNINDAVEKLRHLPFEDLGFARIDHHRHIRCGFPEVIYSPGKSTDEIVQIFETLAKTGHNVLATRADKEPFEKIIQRGNYPDTKYDEKARAIYLVQQKTEQKDGVVIVSAGTADGPVTAEAAITAKIMGHEAEVIRDAGVAGIHRLLGHTEALQKANVVVVIAGMEGALASVVGGLVDCPVIAVPTSVGYGANFEGLAALLAMLNSCASGVVVVNIDNGFSAGYTAALINEKITGK